MSEKVEETIKYSNKEAIKDVTEFSEPAQYTLIEDAQSLNQCCQAWQSQPFLAMDTEFIRTSTFYPKIGLIQVCDGEKNYLIDPLVIDDWQAFTALMLSPSVIKIFHSCSEDLLVFCSFLNIIPSPIFDTQIAAAFLNEGFALSYQNLVKVRHQIDLPKGETRSDWLQRPLSSKQYQYAALDVEYLPAIYAYQSKMLEEKGQLSWHTEECQRLVNTYQNEMSADFSLYYLGMKSAWQLSGVHLAALKSMAAWRETRARERDKPRSWVIKDAELIAIAKSLPSSKQQLSSIQGVAQNFIHYEGEQILTIIADIKEMGEENFPEKLPRPLSSGQKNKLKKAQGFAETVSKTVSVPVEVLARKRCLVSLFNAVNKIRESSNSKALKEEDIVIPDELLGWRKPLLLAKLIEIFQ